MVLRVTVDPSVGNEGGYTPCPEGRYELEVVDYKVDQSNNTKTQRLNLKCEVKDGPPGVKLGRTVYVPLWLSPKAAWRVKEACSAAGISYEIEEVETATGLEETVVFEESEFLAKRFKASCKHEMYNDKPQERWNNLAPLAATTSAPPAQPPAQAAATVQAAPALSETVDQPAGVGQVRRRRVAS